MDQETYQLTVINLLTQIAEDMRVMRQQRRPLAYGRNPTMVDVIENCKAVLQEHSKGLTTRELLDALTRRGVSILSVHPENYLGVMIWRDAKTTHPALARNGRRHILAPR